MLLSNAVKYDVRIFNMLNIGTLVDLSAMRGTLHAIHGAIPALLALLILVHIIIAVIHAIRRDAVFKRVSPFS